MYTDINYVCTCRYPEVATYVSALHSVEGKTVPHVTIPVHHPLLVLILASMVGLVM